jgi:hypothetical protein
MKLPSTKARNLLRLFSIVSITPMLIMATCNKEDPLWVAPSATLKVYSTQSTFLKTVFANKNEFSGEEESYTWIQTNDVGNIVIDAMAGQLDKNVSKIVLHFEPVYASQYPLCYQEGNPNGPMHVELFPGAGGAIDIEKVTPPVDLYSFKYFLKEYLKGYRCPANTPILNLRFDVWITVWNTKNRDRDSPRIRLEVTIDPNTL